MNDQEWKKTIVSQFNDFAVVENGKVVEDYYGEYQDKMIDLDDEVITFYKIVCHDIFEDEPLGFETGSRHPDAMMSETLPMWDEEADLNDSEWQRIENMQEVAEEECQRQGVECSVGNSVSRDKCGYAYISFDSNDLPLADPAVVSEIVRGTFGNYY